MPGNSLKKKSCSSMTITSYKTLAKAYDDAGKYLRDTNKFTNTKVFMVSHFPVNAGKAKAYYDANNTPESDRKVVYSTNENKCTSGYMSAWKYYHSGETFKSALTNIGSFIKYVDVFSKYLLPKDLNAQTMKWNPDRPYSFTITDTQHMDKTTSNTYTKYMFDQILSVD